MARYHSIFGALLQLTVIQVSARKIYDGPSPAPGYIPPLSKDASDDVSLLSAQICAILGAYIAFVILLGMGLQLYGKRLRYAAQNRSNYDGAETVKSSSAVRWQLPASSRGHRHWQWPTAMLSTQSTHDRSKAKGSAVARFPCVDEQIVENDKRKRQRELEHLYDAVLSHDELNYGKAQLSSDQTADEPISTTLRSPRPPLELGSPANSWDIHRHSRGLGRSPNTRSLCSAVPAFGPNSLPIPSVSELSDLPRVSSSMHSSNHAPGGDCSVPAEISFGKATDIRGTRLVTTNHIGVVGHETVCNNSVRGSPLSIGTVSTHSRTSNSQDIVATGKQHSTVNKPPVPCHITTKCRHPETPLWPHPQPLTQTSRTMMLPSNSTPKPSPVVVPKWTSASALPFRVLDAQSPTKQVIRSTTVETKADTRGLSSPTRPPRTGKQVPYSPYMPFTPVTPVISHLVGKVERKITQREHGRRVIFAEDVVKDAKELWGDGY